MAALGAVLHVDRRAQQQSPRVGENAALTGPNAGRETGGGIWPCALAPNRATCSSALTLEQRGRWRGSWVRSGPVRSTSQPVPGAGVSRQGSPERESAKRVYIACTLLRTKRDGVMHCLRAIVTMPGKEGVAWGSALQSRSSSDNVG
jgi:hypothetical protein